MIIDLVGPIDLSKMTDSGQLYNLYQLSKDQFILKYHDDIPIRQVNDHTIESPAGWDNTLISSKRSSKP